MAHSGEIGICAIASGYTTKASPGPNRKEIKHGIQYPVELDSTDWPLGLPNAKHVIEWATLHCFMKKQNIFWQIIPLNGKVR